MKKRATGWLSFFLCLCFLLCPLKANASSTDQANGFINTDQACTLDLTYSFDTLLFSDVHVALYQVATVSRDFQYTATKAFTACGLNFNGVVSQSEWNTIRSTLDNYIAASGVTPVCTQQTNADGNVIFTDLEPGLYLTSAVQVTHDGFRYYFASVLSALPNLNEENSWEYDVSAKCKPDVDNPTGEDIAYKVLKLWKDDGKEEKRTESIEIEIIKDGKTVKTVVLSDDNDWSFSWYAEDDGSVWSVTEKNIPKGYTMTVEKNLTTFTVINSLPPPPPDIPQTGDTFNIGLYVVLMCLSGTALILLTVTKRRKQYE